jgi:hypothetical protein
MDADSSIELGPDAPALEIPWHDPEGQLHYLDLRSAPASLEQNVECIPEAASFPALRRFLLELNSLLSPWQTVKCDVWCQESASGENAAPEDNAANLYGADFTQNSYVDLVLDEANVSLRDSLDLHRRLASDLALRLEENETLEASAEIVVRRCYFHRGTSAKAMSESDAGYCLTIFLTGYGASPVEAAENWNKAMEFAAGCLLELQPQ